MIIARLLFPSPGRSTAAKSTRLKEPTPSSNQPAQAVWCPTNEATCEVTLLGFGLIFVDPEENSENTNEGRFSPRLF